MYTDIYKDHMYPVELFGKTALYTEGTIPREEVPDGWYRYDLCGTDQKPDKPLILTDLAVVYRTGAVLSPVPLKRDTTLERRVKDQLFAEGRPVTLADFCREQNLSCPQDPRKYVLRPASPTEVGFFYAQTPEEDEKQGAIGHVRMDFGYEGKEFWHTWWPRGPEELNTPEFKAELGQVIGELRQSVLESLSSMRRYTGDSEWQKTYTTDTLPFAQVKNHGQKPKYHVEDDHPGIISREDFQRVQELIAARREVFYRGSAPSGSVLRGHLFCGHCGCLLRRKVIRETAYWVCNRRDENKNVCPIPQIPEPALTAALLRLHNKLMLHGSEFLQAMLDQLRELQERELRSNQKLSDIDREIAKLSAQNLVLIRLKSKGCADPALILSQTEEMGRRLRELRRDRRKVLDAAGGDDQILATESMLEYLSGAQWQTEVSPELFETLVERLTVVSAQEVKLRLLNGLELTERLV